MEKQHWVIDYETLLNCTILVAEHYRDGIVHEFVIHKERNDILPLVDFLYQCKTNKEFHISFNGLTFDSQISEFIIRNSDTLVNMDAELLANEIYGVAQDIIDRQNNDEFPEFSEKDLSIPQIDVFKLNHWDNPAKRSSLKWIQYTMDWHNIQDMPIHHGQYIRTLDEIETILSYCRNDVKSTKNIYRLCRNHIALRRDLTKTYDIRLMSASEPKISKELFLHFLSKQLGEDKYELRQLRTFRSTIVVKDIILPYVKFKTKTFNDLLDMFNSVVIDDPLVLKGAFKYSFDYKGAKTDFGLGGVHGANKRGIYESTEDKIVMTSDVVSFYPNLIIRNKWSPAHLPSAQFNELYEWFFKERRKISKKDVRNYIYKIILNSTYGLSNDKNSFLYDPELTLRVTINGQLSLMMLYEMITEGIPGSKPIMQNTDGLETLIPREYEEKYIQICQEWEELTDLELEHDTYNKIYFADVNNYIALYNYKEVDKTTFEEIKKSNPHYLFKQEGEKFYYAATKCKGRFEFTDLALHKNKSFLIIPKAIYNFFIHGVSPEETLYENHNIFDYCAGFKATSGWVLEKLIYSQGEITKEKLQKVIRYYVSNDGHKIVKRNTMDGREVQLEADRRAMLTEYNVHVEKPWDNYDINLGYYLDNIYKEINNIEYNSNQISLF